MKCMGYRKGLDSYNCHTNMCFHGLGIKRPKLGNGCCGCLLASITFSAYSNGQEQAQDLGIEGPKIMYVYIWEVPSRYFGNSCWGCLLALVLNISGRMRASKLKEAFVFLPNSLLHKFILLL